MTEPKQVRLNRSEKINLPLSEMLRQRLGLSRMEAVVACGLADGLTYEEIADRCCISYHTVHSHVSSIHRKAGVSSNARLLALIRREGLDPR
jgi:DNA-binding CsgD family transcriptional regulator